MDKKVKLNKKVIRNLEFLGWNIGYGLRCWGEEAQKIILKEIKKSMKVK